MCNKPDIHKSKVADGIFFREKVLEDIGVRVWPFQQCLVAKQQLESYLLGLAKDYPDIDIPVTTWRFKELYLVLKQAGGIHLRYNATVKGKTVNLNIWVMRNHDMYLAMPRGKLIEEWRTQTAAV